ncbi:MAG: RsmE family RNA methyltransferase [Nitrospiraceae bacterium]|nr:RsmE family RNA methyltransferase [Nitrospiraceae bacterium]
MSHVYRFHISADTDTSDTISLTESEAHHALHVVRIQVGDAVVLFDGQGREIDGLVERATKREVFVSPTGERHTPCPEPRVVLAQAWLHREKSVEELVRKGTELGVSRFVFFRAKHSERKPRMNEKWRRTSIEVCKQCGRNWLPAFSILDDLEDVLELVPGRFLVAAKDAAPTPLRNCVGEEDVVIAVGPEGDFTDSELCLLAAHDAAPISLGDATYRSEAAAALATSLVLYEMGRLGPLP